VFVNPVRSTLIIGNGPPSVSLLVPAWREEGWEPHRLEPSLRNEGAAG